MADAFRFSRDILLDAPARDLWALFSATDRMNRALGLPPVRYEPHPDDPLLKLARAELLRGLVSLSWDEHPFEWAQGRFYSVRRVFHRGPLAELSAALRFHPEGQGTRLEALCDVRARGLAGPLAARIIGRKFCEDVARMGRRFESSLQDRSLHPFRRPRPKSSVRRDRLQALLAGLRGSVPPELLGRLGRHLREGYDEEVVRMRPFVLADAWERDRIEVLKCFLRATRCGLLDARWEVLCPNCRVPKASAAGLKDLPGEAHCEVCGITFEGEWDRGVEVRFSVSPAVRRAEDAVYCIGGPANSAHRLAQAWLPPGTARGLALDLHGRPYYVRSLRGASRLRLAADPAGPSRLTVSFRGGEPAAAGELRFKPGPVELTLDNPAGEAPVWVGVDEEGFGDKGATAALVTALQEFRDLFSSEALSPGEAVGVRRLAVMFTDLKDSTALYQRVGDARAYALVRDHFTILREAVARSDGGLVKTIGDAVMAIFPSSEQAVRAAVDIHLGIERKNRDAPEKILVKIGVHAGPTLAIEANGTLDYFGTTINEAARIQAQSEGGDVVLSEAVRRDAGVPELLRREGLALEPFSARLKGLPEDYRLWRCRVLVSDGGNRPQ